MNPCTVSAKAAGGRWTRRLLGLATLCLVLTHAGPARSQDGPGPEEFECQALANGVLLSWDDLALTTGFVANLIREEDTEGRAEVLALLDPDSTWYFDAAVPDGDYTYTIDIVLINGIAPPNRSHCDVRVGRAETLRCETFGGIATPPQVLIGWDPISENVPVEAIVIQRDGETIAELDPGAFEFQEEPANGAHEYAVRATLRAGVRGGREPLEIGTCIVEFEPPVLDGLVRGDCNQDGSHDISDAVCLLRVLFVGDMPADCQKSLDTNDDGDVEITDAIVLLSFLFQMGAPIEQPFPECGHDRTPDDLSCEFFPSCFNPPPP